MDEVIGDINTADFHWNITRDHLVRYLQRWHGEADKGGTHWVHKSTHHFDLVNWWLDSDPVEVFAYSDLKHFGPKGSFRHLDRIQWHQRLEGRVGGWPDPEGYQEWILTPLGKRAVNQANRFVLKT